MAAPRLRFWCRFRRSLSLAAIALGVASWAAGCGGPSAGDPSAPAPSPTPPVPTASIDPCAAALQQNDVTMLDRPPGPASKVPSAFGRDKVAVDDVLWDHRSRADGRVVAQQRVADAASIDIGDIAVIEDDGTLIQPSNRFDLARSGLLLRPSDVAFDVSPVDPSFRTPLGTRLTLADDDTVRLDLAIPLPFAGSARQSVFVNSDGNLTFEEGDVATSERSVARVVNGVPRIAPFFADLDPSAGGRVFASNSREGLTVTWCAVPGFARSETATVQVTLRADGAVELRFGESHTLPDGVVALSGGRGAPFAPLDLSAGGRGAGTVGERFAARPSVDLVNVSTRFYATHADNFDQLVIFGDQRLIADANVFAFETTVANAVEGIGADVVDRSREFGSAGRLQSVVNMDSLAKYPADPSARVLGENSTLSVLAHEVGHRWLAFLRFRGLDGQTSGALLGRDDSHWSFFFDSNASVMEGNGIEDLGGGSFRTVDAVRRYSVLDQYAMGLLAPSQVPTFFFVEAPLNVAPEQSAVSAPRVGVTFAGTRRDVTIQDVITVLGERRPSSATSPKAFSQAYVYLIARGRSVTADEVSRLDRIRQEFETFFARATSNRMRLTTTLR